MRIEGTYTKEKKIINKLQCVNGAYSLKSEVTIRQHNPYNILILYIRRKSSAAEV